MGPVLLGTSFGSSERANVLLLYQIAIFGQVFKKLHKALPQMLMIDLQSASPKLLAVKDLELAIPGIAPCRQS